MLNKQAIKTAIVALEFLERARTSGGSKPDATIDIIDTQNTLELMRKLDNGDIIADIWWDDVFSLQSDEDTFTKDERITLDEAREVLRRASNNHDAEVGINWGVLDSIMRDVRGGDYKH